MDVADSFQNLDREIKDGNLDLKGVARAVMQFERTVMRLELVCKAFYTIMQDDSMRNDSSYLQVFGQCLQYTKLKQALSILLASLSPKDTRKEKLKLAIGRTHCPKDYKKEINEVSSELASIRDSALAPFSPSGSMRYSCNYGPIIGLDVSSLKPTCGFGPLLVASPSLAIPSRFIPEIGIGIGISFRKEVLIGVGVGIPLCSYSDTEGLPRREPVEALFRKLCCSLVKFQEMESSSKINTPVEELNTTASTIRPGNR